MIKKLSPEVDGITPKLLKKIVNETSVQLDIFLIYPAEWKEANVTPLFKKGSRSKTENYYRPVSLTSVLCKLLETFIRDHMVDFLVKNKLITKSQQTPTQ